MSQIQVGKIAKSTISHTILGLVAISCIFPLVWMIASALKTQATVFTEGETWYLLVHTECKHLGADNLCGIYDTRPQICREYTTDDCKTYLVLERKVFDVWELDERVMERLYAADNQKANVLDALDNHNTKIRAANQRRFYERKNEDLDIIVSSLKSTKGRWTFKNRDNELVQLDDATNGYSGVIDDRK